MSIICSCASEACQILGCSRIREMQQKYGNQMGCGSITFSPNIQPDKPIPMGGQHSVVEKTPFTDKESLRILEKFQQQLTETHNNNRKPHKCPVCDGSGENDICSGSLTQIETCHGCSGTGIVWG